MLKTCNPRTTAKNASNALAAILPMALILCASWPLSAETAKSPTGSSRYTTSKGTPVPAPVSAPPIAPAAPPARPVRSVLLIKPKIEMWSDQIEAHGHIMPWQETRIGTEIGGLLLVSVLANEGDVVKKGQVLARLNPAPVEVELDAANARLMEAQAASEQAVGTLERAKRLVTSGGVSQQEMTLYETQKQTAAARLNAARSQVKAQQLKLNATTLVAPDDGVISSRSVVEGAIVQPGIELFRLIRHGRLEWRAEVKGETLLKLSVGQEVTVKSPLDIEVKGQVRQISPTIDMTTRNGLVYVDLPLDTNLKAGLSVSGTLTLDKRKTLVLPSSAVLHEGTVSRVFKVNADNKIETVDVKIGRIRDGQEEITSGLDGHTNVVAKDIELLKTGDEVSVKEAPERQKVSQASSGSRQAEEKVVGAQQDVAATGLPAAAQ